MKKVMKSNFGFLIPKKKKDLIVGGGGCFIQSGFKKGTGGNE